MINNRISAKAILQQISSAYGITISRKADCIEWMADCMELIGYHTGFVNKFELIPVDNYTIEQPVDFQSLNYIMLPDGKILTKGNPKQQPIPVSQNDFVSDIYGLIEAKKELACMDVEEFFKAVNGQPGMTDNRGEYMKRLDEQIYKRLDHINIRQSVTTNAFYYESESSWKTNWEGNVIVFYKAFPLDDEGWPLIVDEINYKMALRWYVLQCLMQNGLKHPLLKYEDVFTMAESYIHKASNYGAKFDRSQKEAFIKNWATGYQDRPGYYEN